MAKLGSAYVDIVANSKLKTGFASAKNETDKFARDLQKGLDSINFFSSFARYGAIAAGVLLPIKKAIDEITQAAERQEKRFAFNNLAASVGANTTKIIASVRAASGEMLSMQETIETTSRAMLLGIGPDVIPKLMEIARASSKVTGQSMSQAFSDITLGVARQSKMILDNLGILLDYDTHLKKVAGSLGKTVDGLTDTERRQAFLNATFEAGNEIVTRVGSSTDSLNERIIKFKTTLADSVNTLRDYVTGISLLDRAIAASKFGTLTDQYTKQKEELDNLLPRYKQLKESMDIMLQGKSPEVGEIKSKIDELITKRKELEGSLDFQLGSKSAIEDIAKIESKINDLQLRMQGLSTEGFQVKPSIVKEFGEVESKVLALQKSLNSISKGFGIGNSVEEIKKLKTELQEPINIEEANKAYAKIYESLKVKTEGWVEFNIKQYEKEKEEFIEKTHDKLLAEQVFQDKVNKLIEEYQSSQEDKPETAALIEKEEAYNKMYSSLKVKTESWVSYNLKKIEQEKEEFIKAGVDKAEAEKNALEKSKGVIEEYTSSIRAAREQDEAAAKRRDEIYSDMYEDLKIYNQNYYDFRKGLLEKQRDEEITVTHDTILAWEAYYARLRLLQEEQLKNSKSFVDGIRGYMMELNRDQETWGKLSYGMMKDLQSGMTSTVSGFFGDVIKGQKSFKDAWKGLVSNMAEVFIDAVTRMIAKWIVFKIISSIGGSFAGSSTSGAWAGMGGGASAGGVFAHAGGYIGRGHTPVRYHNGGNVFPDLKSYEVPAILKRGEYVINDTSVSKYGKDIFHTINKGTVSKEQINTLFSNHNAGRISIPKPDIQIPTFEGMGLRSEGQETSEYTGGAMVVNNTFHFNTSAIDESSVDQFFKKNAPRIQDIVGEGVERSMSYAKRLRGRDTR